jgi:glutaminyl-peptide cyclotransferase
MRRWRYYSIEIVLIAVLGAAVAYFGYLVYGLFPTDVQELFSGERAQIYIARQLEFGERVAGSDSGAHTGDWLADELSKLDWDVIKQSYAVSETLVARNVIAQIGDGPEAGPVVILSTHYDTRAIADKDPDTEKQSQPTPGANAGGSGTAVLLELARTLNVKKVMKSDLTVCLVFFDGEDNGGLPGWDYAMGSEVFLQRIETDSPRCRSARAAIYLDRVGGNDASVAVVGPNSKPLVDALRQTADEVGYSGTFRGPHRREDVDALTRFTEAGVPAVMLADLGYDFYHTTNDTLSKIGADTLQRVGDVLKAWLEEGAQF